MDLGAWELGAWELGAWGRDLAVARLLVERPGEVGVEAAALEEELRERLAGTRRLALAGLRQLGGHHAPLNREMKEGHVDLRHRVQPTR